MSASSCGIVVASTSMPATRVLVGGGPARAAGALAAGSQSASARLAERTRERRSRLLTEDLHGIGWGVLTRESVRVADVLMERRVSRLGNGRSAPVSNGDSRSGTPALRRPSDRTGAADASGEEGGDERIRVEWEQIADLLPDPDEPDRNLEPVLDREDDSALGGRLE